MKKTLNIDLSSRRLLGIASDMVDAHDYIGALKMLNKNADVGFNDEEAYMLYAEIYDDIGLHERCVNSWFKYIDSTDSDDLGDAYEGLAVAYMNLGNEHHSAFYYNKLLKDTEGLDAETRREIMDGFLVHEKNPLKFVYPPEIADCSDAISDGIDKMKKGEYDEAVAQFETIDEGNKEYTAARNYIAMCKIISDKYDEAEQDCLALLEKYPDNVQALTTLAAVKTEKKEYGESRKLAKRLLNLGITDQDELYKIATVCCENKMHEEAFGIFEKLDDEFYYDCAMLYFKAVSAFNCGKYDECFAAFDRLLTINPEAVTAKFFCNSAHEMVESGEIEELTYFYRLPQAQKETTLKTLAAISKLSVANARKFTDLVDITDCLLWCINDTEITQDDELKTLAAACAVKTGMDDFVCDMLLNAFLSDHLKVQIITMLAERNEENCFGVVICNIYKRLFLHRLELGRLKKKNFVLAYARLTAHFGILDPKYSETFASTTEKVYVRLERKGMLSLASDTDALTAAIFHTAAVREPKITRNRLAMFFDTTDKKIDKILREI